MPSKRKENMDKRSKMMEKGRQELLKMWRCLEVMHRNSDPEGDREVYQNAKQRLIKGQKICFQIEGKLKK